MLSFYTGINNALGEIWLGLVTDSQSAQDFCAILPEIFSCAYNKCFQDQTPETFMPVAKAHEFRADIDSLEKRFRRRAAEQAPGATASILGHDVVGDPPELSTEGETQQRLSKRHLEKKLVRRNEKYKKIDEALNAISAACPKSHEEVFRFLDDRDVPIPNRKLFKSAGGWLKGFRHDPHAASAWLSLVWRRLGLPAFQRGPKK